MNSDDVADVAGILPELTRSWQAEPDLDHLLDAVVRSVAVVVPGVHHASISLYDGEPVLATVARTDKVIGLVDEQQYAAGEGPCVDAARTRETTRADDLATDRRWPTVGPYAVRLGVNSMISFPLFVLRESFGALNLASHRPGAFDDRAESLGHLVAAQAAVAMAGARRDRQLTEAIASRDLIGQAKGILMERHGITGDRAFAMLVGTSQDTNIKLVAVAEYLVREAARDRPGRRRPHRRTA